MRKALAALVMAGLMMVIGPGGPAGALDCVPVAHVLPQMDTIVEGRISDIPAQGMVRLEVTAYYRGAGGPVLEAEVVGLGRGQRMDWTYEPKRGDRVLIGFKRVDGALRNDVCHPFYVLSRGEEPSAEIREMLGEGRVPEGAAEPGTGRIPLWPLIGGAAAGAAAAWFVVRRRRARRVGG